ncbi:Calpain-A [Halotydeus destructor]|nr:Calpain-A [Halotydeus destructor]
MPEPYFFKFGEKGSGIRAQSSAAIQDFASIKQKCQASGELFTDKVFPANESSLYFSPGRRKAIQWIRAKDLGGDDTRFINEGASRFDVCQGELGDCWLLAAVANLTLNNKLFHRVVPRDQSFIGDDYAGIFHFRFWQYGKWIDVVIDDFLPTYNGRLIYMHSKDTNEFWGALIEKAYAKLHGSYEALKGGTTCEAMEDFTGGLTEWYELQNDSECPPNLFQIMMKAHQRSSFMGCSIDALDASQMEAELSNGLIRGHAYSVTSVKFVELKTSRMSGKIPLLRVRNPWGNEAEWKGAWSDGSKEWSVISEDEKAELGLSFSADGEFWISFQDFKSNFTRLEICNLTPEPLDEEEGSPKQWEASVFDGSWVSGVSAGGCRNNLNTYAMNPQYLISLVDIDEEDDDDMCTLIVALMQKNHRSKRKMGLESLSIGFGIYKLKDGQIDTDSNPDAQAGFQKHLLNTDFFRYNQSVARSPTFVNLREVTARFRLAQGQYCIIPSTYDPNEEGEFILRIFSEKPPQDVEENDDEISAVEPEDLPEGDVMIHVPSMPTRRDAGSKEVLPESSNNNLLEILKILRTCWMIFNPPNNETQMPAHQEKEDEEQAAKSSQSTDDFFAKVAGDDMEVCATELQEILNFALKKEFSFDGFTLDSCRSMVALLDEDRSGKLGLDEFTSLWRYVRHWCNVFKKHDADNSNSISANELRAAFNEAGLTVNRHILQCLVLRFGKVIGGNKGDIKVERALTLNDFVHCCIKLKYSILTWTSHAKAAKPNMGSMYGFPGYGGLGGVSLSRRGSKAIGLGGPSATFTLDEWVERMMYS